MTNLRIAQIGYVVLALLTGIFLEHLLLAVFGLMSLTQPLTTPRFGSDSWTYASFIGLAISFGAAWYLWKRPDTHDVSVDIVTELKRVTWPSFAETRAATIAVIVASVIAAVLLGLFDLFWQFLTDKIQNPSL